LPPPRGFFWIKTECNQNFRFFSATKIYFIDEVREMKSKIYKIINDVNDKVYVW